MSPFVRIPCPKCRAPKDSIRVRWCEGSHSYYGAGKNCPRHPMSQPPPDHLHHHCPICGYERVTLPADANRSANRSSEKP